MWPFAARSSRVNTVSPHPANLPDFKAFEVSNAPLKVWLPQVLLDRVNWLSKENDSSRPDVIRALIFQNLYGQVVYQAMCNYKNSRDQESWRRKSQAGESGASARVDAWLHGMVEETKFSRKRETAIDLEWLGRSDEDITVTLPPKLKADLAEIARLHGLTPSSYVRKLLVQALLGEEAHSRWQHAIGKLSPDIERLERE